MSVKKSILICSVIFIYSFSTYSQDTSDNIGNNIFEMGFSIGTPAMFNFHSAYWFSKLGVGGSIFYLPEMCGGIELGLQYRFVDKKNIRFSASLSTGFSSLGGNTWKQIIRKDDTQSMQLLSKPLNYLYIGPNINLRLKRFFIQTGIAIGYGDYRNPQLMFQIGGMFRKSLKRD